MEAGVVIRVLLVIATIVGVASPAAADETPSISTPATRLDLEGLVAIADALMIERAPSWSRCPDLYGVAVENWPGAADVWARLDYIFWREARCKPGAINRRSGTRGVMQLTRGNLRRYGISYADALDPATNIAAGYRLSREAVGYGWSPWRPWGMR